MKENEFGWLTISPDYIEASEDDDAVFMPQLWWIVDSYDETTNVWEEPIPLTEEGRKFAEEWLDDDSRGYDLCYGRAYGLAADYSAQQVWDMIKSDKDYHS